jgi:hypothetical protein
MQLPDFTVEHLKQLPLRAIVAFAARCARRVEPLAQRQEGDPEREDRGVAIETALRMAEDFAGGADASPLPSVVAAIDGIAADPGGPLGSRSASGSAAAAAHAASSAWHAMGIREIECYKPPEGRTKVDRERIGTLEHVTVDLAALDAFTAAVEAYGAVGYYNEEFVAAALNDYDRLLRMSLGRYPELGEPIDPSPSGPLGRL